MSLNKLTGLHETWFEIYVTGGNSNFLELILQRAVIAKLETSELMRSEELCMSQNLSKYASFFTVSSL
jgi:hypothetical protein